MDAMYLRDVEHREADGGATGVYDLPAEAHERSATPMAAHGYVR